MKPFMAALITKIYPNTAYNKVDASFDYKNVYLAFAIKKAKTIQKLIHPNLLTNLEKDNTWAVLTSLENKQMLTHNSICSQFVSTAFCKIAVERFIKVEKLGSTTDLRENIINSFAV